MTENSVYTAPRRVILTFIREFIEDKGYPPTVREITEGVGYRSTSSTYWQLENLKFAGLIELDKGVARGIRVTGKAL